MSSTEQGATSGAGVRPAPEAETASSFRLRADRPRVTRLSRKVLIGGTALALTLISAAVFLALQTREKRPPASDELYSTDHHNVADKLAGLPKDYGSIPPDVPRLGPPLPGDLGRPIVAAQTQTGPLANDAEQQRINQESEAARTSKVFASTTPRPSPGQAGPAEVSPMGATSTDDASAQNGQDHKLTFANAPVDRRTTSPDRLAKPASPFVIQAGTIIPAALITGIRSDLPGQNDAAPVRECYPAR
jgi:type IV secretion system protein VirB10